MILHALLWLALGAQAQVMTGSGGFELAVHRAVPGAESAVDTFGSSFSLRSVAPGSSAGGRIFGPGFFQLETAPWGFNLFSRLVENLIASPAALDSVVVRSFAAKEDFDFFFNPSPLTSPQRVDPGRILQANSALALTVGPKAALVANRVVELNLLLASGGFQDSLAKPVTLELSFPDADGDGLVDGADPPIRARTLQIYTLDEARGAWVRLPGSSVNQAARKVSAFFPHLSVYALIGTADTSVESVYAFPVPWAPNSGDPEDGSLAGGITFTNLPSEGRIDIYTVAGQRVRTLDIPPELFPPQLKWDVRTAGGSLVASGAYIWRVESGRKSKTGKLLVIR